ncbi:MAG TPA: Gfo/Idh/MocA family oxidoreductase [Planctomycetota bacterium]|nr:Gfo/Idh/MocA family oxidoreductase [Planctomycetota bacterium]
MDRPLTFIILGCGGRGNAFSQSIEANPLFGTVVAVADPDAARRDRVGDRHGVPADMRFASWEEALARPKLAEVCINTTMDKLHVASGVKALDLGYHMLLEKPMATSLADCVAIDAARQRNQRVVAVCHSMRYDRTHAEMIRLLRARTIGDIVSLDQLEAVEHTHQAHSFVRGNWGNESRSTFMLMAKSCHDIDAIAYTIGTPCERVSSFGSLTLFKAERAPAGAPARCTDGCPVEASCPYSALKLYTGDSAKQHWYAHPAGTAGLPTAQQVEMMRTSPYGRCVYRCDNDVVDHQVVNMEFAGGVTATFTMTAFTTFGGRQIRIHGTEGFMAVDLTARTIEWTVFSTGQRHRVDIAAQRGSHGGADDNILAEFIAAVRRGDPNGVLTTTAESLRTHAIVFAAERSRRERRMVEMSELVGARTATAS